MAATPHGNRKRHLSIDPMMPKRIKAGPGRKSLYKAEYCEVIETFGRQGKSVSQIAELLNVDRTTLARWAGENDEFAASLARAKTFEQAWWERKAQQSLGRKHFQAQLWRHSMAGRFKEDYAESRNVDVNISLEGIVGSLFAPKPVQAIEGKAETVQDAPKPPKPEGDLS